MCSGFDSRTRRHMWVDFVAGSLLCSERFFSGYSGFPLSSKTNISKFQFGLDVRHLIMIAKALPVFDVKFAHTFDVSVVCVWRLIDDDLGQAIVKIAMELRTVGE